MNFSGTFKRLTMETKSKKTLDIHKNSNLFFMIGLIISLLLVKLVFEYRSYDKLQAVDLGLTMEDEFDDQIEIPATEQFAPPPPVLQIPEVVEVADEEEIKEDIKVNLDVEFTDYTVPEKNADIKVAAAEPNTENIAKEEEDEIFLIVEEQPTPNGGLEGFYLYIKNNLKYPSLARKMGVEGRVFVEFVISKTGKLEELKVAKGIGYGCDEAALEVLKNAPLWKPGKQRGRPVKVRMTIPILFKMIKISE